MRLERAYQLILLGVRTAKPFSLLAQVYDAIMDDIDYEAWVDFILQTVSVAGWRGGAVLDIGCGTGNSTFPVFVRGFDVTGLDMSAEMLGVARSKLSPVDFVQADFTDFALERRFTLVYSVFDALNNLLKPADFSRMAERVHAHLEPGGFFFFDINTTVGLRDLWEAGRAEGWVGDVYYRWDHSFDEATGLAKVEAYCENERTGFTEVHFERAYDETEVRTLLAAAGFTDVRALSYPSGDEAAPNEPRLWIMARRTLGDT